MNIWQKLDGTRFTLWIKVTKDPFAKARGFSILGKELRCMTYAPIEDEVIDNKGQVMFMKCWPVHPDEIRRVVPRLLASRYGAEHGSKPWMFPVEFCETFPRPSNFLEKKIIDIY